MSPSFPLVESPLDGPLELQDVAAAASSDTASAVRRDHARIHILEPPVLRWPVATCLLSISYTLTQRRHAGDLESDGACLKTSRAANE
jgi:hypothetical protein